MDKARASAHLCTSDVNRLAVALACCVSLAAHAFDLEGHRGARGLAPENTLPAFAKALSIGVGTLELDVGVTRDGVVVISHERGMMPDIARGPDGGGVGLPGAVIPDVHYAERER